MSIDTGTSAYHFTIGDIACSIISDGSLAYADPAHLFFVNAPNAERDRALRTAGIEPDAWHEYVSPHCALLVETGGQRILVDAGGGGFVPSDGRLHDNLRGEGIALDSINVVILTHAHADHVGGILDAAHRPAFPHARFVLWREEWDFWTGPADLSHLPLPEQSKAALVALAKRSLLPIEGQVDLIDEDTSVAPGIRIMAAPGHTPGHAAVLVSSGSDQLLWSGDAILHPFNIRRPGWYSTFDLDPNKAVTTRRALLARAGDEGILLHATHFPWPGLGHVARQNDRFLWEPVKS